MHITCYCVNRLKEEIKILKKGSIRFSDSVGHQRSLQHRLNGCHEFRQTCYLRRGGAEDVAETLL